MPESWPEQRRRLESLATALHDGAETGTLRAALARVDAVEAAALALCRELQCPAMEYLHPAVQQAWTRLFDLLEGKVNR